MTILDYIYFASAACGVVAVLAKLRNGWGSPQLWAVRTSFALVATLVWACAPTTIRLLNDATGIANFTAVFVYCLLVAFAASALCLAAFWRYPAERAWARVRIILAVYGLALAVMIWLFSQSSVSVERLTDFETYYAGQPTVVALLLIYIVATTVGEGVICVGCLAWARSPDYADQPWLRRGLRAYGIASGLAMVAFAQKIAAVLLAATGRHWLDTVNVAVVATLILPGMLVGLCGVLLPIWGPRLSRLAGWLRRWRAFRTLRPLHLALAQALPGVVFVADGKRRDPYHLVRRQLIELSDFRLALSPLFDPAVADTARRLGEQAGLTVEDVRAVVQAAQIRAALVLHAAGTEAVSTHPDVDDVQDGANVAGELSEWERIARAYAGSPIVAAALADTAPAAAAAATA